jgi:hypothetical protein
MLSNRNSKSAQHPATETLKGNQPQPRSERSARLPLRVFVLSHRTQADFNDFRKKSRCCGQRLAGLRCLLDTLFLRWATNQIAARLAAKDYATHDPSPEQRTV